MYEAHFGFSEKPFKLSPDPKFFFASSLHKRAQSYLHYGLEQGEGFIVITGPIGAGKTTLARSLLAEVANSDNIVATQIVTSRLSPIELLQVIASELKLPAQDSKAALLKSIEAYLLRLHGHGKRTLLIVDEAQNLPAETVEELRMLSNFQQNDKPLLQSFLLGQEELREIIQSPQMEQFRQRIIASCHLVPLTLQETKDYIEFRLTQVGWKHNPKLGEDAYRLIHQTSGGIPRRINLLMDRVLLYAFLEELQALDKQAVATVAQEMSEEVSGDKHTQAKPAKKEVVAGALSSKTKEILEEVNELLENSIQQKVRMIRYLDKTLKQKMQELDQEAKS